MNGRSVIMMRILFILRKVINNINWTYGLVILRILLATVDIRSFFAKFNGLT